jgi:hypothetical protein
VDRLFQKDWDRNGSSKNLPPFWKAKDGAPVLVFTIGVRLNPVAMTGKRYYITTVEAWQRHAGRFVNSHWVSLPASTSIVLLVDADEGAHLALEDDAAFEALPHPLAQKVISERAQAALAESGVEPGATTFDAAEVLARVHPLLRHRVF